MFKLWHVVRRHNKYREKGVRSITMFIENITQAENYYTEGFEVSIPQPLTIEFSSGKYNFLRGKIVDYVVSEPSEDGTIGQRLSKKRIEELETTEYPSFTFDVVADDTVECFYNVYLLELPSKSGNPIHVDRIELSDDVIPFYEGNEVIKFTLCRFTVPPNCQSLNDIHIEVNRVVKLDVADNS